MAMSPVVPRGWGRTQRRDSRELRLCILHRECGCWHGVERPGSARCPPRTMRALSRCSPHSPARGGSSMERGAPQPAHSPVPPRRRQAAVGSVQVLRILERRGCKPAPDDLSAVRNNTYQMLNLLAEDRPRGEAARGPILEFVASENLLGRLLFLSLLCWHLQGDFTEERKVEQLKLYEMLISQARQPLLRHKSVLTPLLRLLSLCAEPTSAPLENSLVLLLNQLCVSVAKEPSILELFFHSHTDQGPANLIIFSLLIPFIHHEGVLGQQARDALLLIMAMSASNHAVAKSITDNSYFCPVLATGLSALYSSLPRKIEVRGDDWHFLRREDWIGVSSLVLFMNSLEFCNAVIQVAHPLVQKQLVDYVHNGFLVPVMGPALHKTSIEEMIASTAYLDLFLRSVSETALLKTFLRFVLLHRHDNSTILDTLVGRINSNSRLCMVSLSLFRTLLSLNCEDVMLQLVLRYLLPCSHVMLSQKRAVRDLDIYGKTAAKFLSLIPRCCRPESLPPPNREEEHAAWSKGHGSPNVDTSSVVTVPKPSTPSRLSFFMRQQSAAPEAAGPVPCSPGPFVSVLFGKLENMLHNSLYVNFLLTGLVAQLACYPQPLLRSFLLNTNMVFQPSVKSLLQRAEGGMEGWGLPPALARGLSLGAGARAPGRRCRTDPVPAVKSRKPSIGELILRHTNSPTRARQAAQLAFQHVRDGQVLQALAGASLFRGSAERQSEALRVKNAVYCAVIFSEFLKELAAIAQAHAVTSPFLTEPPEE
ncbi:PREDICTED: LOW QUALITY PROTEIN: FTS and Hook-interacting protein [Aptenodytes forsteri]|uniref:LOW QUALITY PROTEIN: FTS and Hook-interacting protein n=1 Tax=Aptenodytes forsteri TaxID=9233 RepID=UPI0004F482A6|nr:PREDICTED: LOW QUALITY PROTEIN: FTS and Hook-interacting protein [Aptenodytes forsteri]